jgi:diguanylate cyclase (GGDEF)-like protein
VNEPLSILLVIRDPEFAQAVHRDLVALGHEPVFAGEDAASALGRLPTPVGIVDTSGLSPEDVLSTCRGLRAEVSDTFLLLLIEDPAVLSLLGIPGVLYDDFMIRSSSSLELQARISAGLERVRVRLAVRQRERQRILSQVMEFSQRLGPFLSPEELFQRVGATLMGLPEVQGVYVATSEEGSEGFTVQLEMGLSAAPSTVTVKQVLEEGRIRTQVRRGDLICVVPLGADPIGFLALRLSRVPGSSPALPLALAGLVSSAYVSARLFASTKSRQLRLERGYLERHRQLNRATASLEQLSKVRDHFLAMLSHDLRSPLAVVLASCQVLEEGLAGELNARQKRSVNVIFRQCTRMTEMVEGLLDNYRAGASPTPEFAEAVDMGLTVQRTMSGYREQFRDAGLVFEVQVLQQSNVRFNPTTMREVICNLVDNAMRHAQESISLTVDADGERGVLRVRDDGPGFPEGVEARLAEKPEGEGSSMGLRLCASILRRGGGRLSLRNPPEGGAEAVVELPLAGVGEETPRVLVATGDLDRLEELEEILADRWEVRGATHSEEILDQCRDGQVDIMVLDMALAGGRDGLEVLADLKADPELGVIPVVVICPPAQPALQERAHTLGALDVLVRPISGKVLLDHLGRAAKLSGSARTSFASRSHDALTGLDTAEAVRGRIVRLVRESRIAHKALPGIWVDALQLREINQRMGYAAGDQLLLWLSSLFKRSVEPGSVICRYKGSRFLLVLPSVPLQDAEALAQAMAREVKEARPRLGAMRARVEVSVEIEDFSRGSRLFKGLEQPEALESSSDG